MNKILSILAGIGGISSFLLYGMYKYEKNKRVNAESKEKKTAAEKQYEQAKSESLTDAEKRNNDIDKMSDKEVIAKWKN